MNELHHNTIMTGQNVLKEKRHPSDISILLSQFKSPLIFILGFAAIVTFILGDIVDTTVISIAILVNTLLGYIQERKAQHGLAALKRILTPKAKIIKNGKKETIDARFLQIGDTISLTSGDRIPADAIIVEAVHVFINESILTGESEPVEKTVYHEQSVYAGTTVTSGRAVCKVTAIGMGTKLGTIANTLETTDEEQTPLELELSRLARLLAVIVVIVCIVIFTIGILRGEPLVFMFSLAVAIAVSAIPEGMAISLTVILSVGMQRILTRNALVRRLVSAETLGSIDTLCVDKTGTLTEGIMKVTHEELVDSEHAILTAVFANNLENPIDIALWEWVQGKDHIDPQKLNDTTPRTHEHPFNSTDKYMSVTNADGTWLKGAPEMILARSSLSSKEKNKWQGKIDHLAGQGLRVIGLAWHEPTATTDAPTFLGILGISDPVRKGVVDAIITCQHAGITVKVVTGDYRLTSETVLHKLGIHISDASTEILEGEELADISDEDLARRVDCVKLFCRVTPDQKLRIVRALQRNGKVVGMTGDGVNDALALKKADIGIVVATASDVAKDTADLVLLDSNFHTIVKAIEEGRVIYQNIRKVVLYLLSDACTEMLMTIAAIVSFVSLPLSAIQILWINMVTDTLPNLALAFEPKEHDLMHHPPRHKSAPIVDDSITRSVVTIGITKAVLGFILFLIYLTTTGNLARAQSVVFTYVALGSLIYIFSLRHLSGPIWLSKPWTNPWLMTAVSIGFFLQVLIIYHPFFQRVFHTTSLGPLDWLVILACGFVLLLVSEIAKRFKKKLIP